MVTAHIARLAIASLAVLAVAVAVSALAQVPARPLGEGGSIRGRIFDADTGQLATRELTIKVQDGPTGRAARGVQAVATGNSGPGADLVPRPPQSDATARAPIG